MYKLEEIDCVKWPVKIDKPVDGGKTLAHQFMAHFRLLDQDEFDALMQECKGDDAQMLLRVVIGWEDDVLDKDGDPLPFSRDNLARLARIPYVRAGMVKAFNRAQYGIAEKN